MTSQTANDPADVGGAETGARLHIRALVEGVFGPRAVESLLWGLGLGIVLGVPLVFGYFMVHAFVLELGLQIMGGESAGTIGEEYAGLYIAASIVLAASLIVLVAAALIIARLRRASWPTILLVAFMLTFVPYVLLFRFVISP